MMEYIISALFVIFTSAVSYMMGRLDGQHKIRMKVYDASSDALNQLIDGYCPDSKWLARVEENNRYYKTLRKHVWGEKE